MIDCPRCAESNEDAARFCTRCGEPLTKTPTRSLLEHPEGEVLDGKFRIIEHIGGGGMGEVYKAEQLSLKKEVAVKLLHHAAFGNETQLERFEREAYTASRLTHPNSIHIIDYGHARDGRPYIAMEYIPGLSLADLIHQKHPLEIPRVLRIMIQILAALEAAHKLGIVHRDLKADNVLVTHVGEADEWVKVLDFGIAKMLERPSGMKTLTVTGHIFGTPEYMSPEHAQGQPVDGRSDIYSAGCLLYELLTGRQPFKHDNPQATLMDQIRKNPMPPSVICSERDIPAALERVVEKAMQKQPAERYQSAAQMRRVLVQLRDEKSPETPKSDVHVTPRHTPTERMGSEIEPEPAEGGTDAPPAAIAAVRPKPMLSESQKIKIPDDDVDELDRLAVERGGAEPPEAVAAMPGARPAGPVAALPAARSVALAREYRPVRVRRVTGVSMVGAEIEPRLWLGLLIAVVLAGGVYALALSSAQSADIAWLSQMAASLFLTRILPFGVLALLVIWLSRKLCERLNATFGWVGLFCVTAAGTALHKIAYFLAALIGGHRVEDTMLDMPDERSGSLGFVEHSYTRGSFYPETIGTRLMALLPFTAIVAAIVGLVLWLFPEIVGPAFALVDVGQSGQELTRFMASRPQAASAFFSALFSATHMKSPLFWIIMLLIFSLAGHARPVRLHVQGFGWLLLIGAFAIVALHLMLVLGGYGSGLLRPLMSANGVLVIAVSLLFGGYLVVWLLSLIARLLRRR